MFLRTTRRSFHTPTALLAQTLVLPAGVDVATVDGSVAADEGNNDTGGVANAAGYVASAQGTGADVGNSNQSLP